MHELGITRNIISICSEQAHSRKVTRVRLEVGLLSGVVPDAIRFCFDVCSQGTLLEGAELEVLEIPVRANAGPVANVSPSSRYLGIVRVVQAT